MDFWMFKRDEGGIYRKKIKKWYFRDFPQKSRNSIVEADAIFSIRSVGNLLHQTFLRIISP